MYLRFEKNTYKLSKYIFHENTCNDVCSFIA